MTVVMIMLMLMVLRMAMMMMMMMLMLMLMMLMQGRCCGDVGGDHSGGSGIQTSVGRQAEPIFLLALWYF